MLYFISGCIVLGIATEILKSKYAKIYTFKYQGQEIIKTPNGLHIKHIGKID